MSEPAKIVLETERILLREMTPADIDALLALYSDSEVKQYVYTEAMDYAETQEELDWIIVGYTEHPGYGLWATIDKVTGEFIGRCGLLPWTIDDRPEVELTYMLAKSHWGQGLGTEIAQALVRYGFEQLQLPRLIACIDEENQGSIRVAEHIGMMFEKIVDTGEGPERLYSCHNPQK
jgi:[ribosomal protein S5]-alanine N-acetyltransferase